MAELDNQVNDWEAKVCVSAISNVLSPIFSSESRTMCDNENVKKLRDTKFFSSAKCRKALNLFF